MADQAPKFEREDRYIVLKRKYLTVEQLAHVLQLTRRMPEEATPDCVVVGADWPECEKVWAMIEARVTGPIPPAGGNEEFYDREVAPVLFDLSMKCRARGMPFLAGVEYEPGEMGRTVGFTGGQGMSIQFADVALQTSNADSIIGWLRNYARKHGHSSIYLMQLGVPLQPTKAH